jgi:hypothetical protein
LRVDVERLNNYPSTKLPDHFLTSVNILNRYHSVSNEEISMPEHKLVQSLKTNNSNFRNITEQKSELQQNFLRLLNKNWQKRACGDSNITTPVFKV